MNYQIDEDQMFNQKGAAADIEIMNQAEETKESSGSDSDNDTAPPIIKNEKMEQDLQVPALEEILFGEEIKEEQAPQLELELIPELPQLNIPQIPEEIMRQPVQLENFVAPALLEEKLDDGWMLNFLFDQSRKINCFCGNLIELYPGDDQCINCKDCLYTICTDCKCFPFHKGYSCTEYEYVVQNHRCKFCDVRLKAPSKNKNPHFKNVCSATECNEICKKFCDKAHQACGHGCHGNVNEAQCLPCLHPQCVSKDEAKTYSITFESNCAICLDTLSSAPAIQIGCKHIFHTECIHRKIQIKQEPGAPIVLSYMECPCCNKFIEIKVGPADLVNDVANGNRMIEVVKRNALYVAKIEGLDKDPRLAIEGDHFFNNLERLALSKLAFYECFKCHVPYFGGMKDCAELIRQQEEEKHPDPSELVCPHCIASGEGAARTSCEKHGNMNILWKCRFCCEVAVWFCWGTTHFCEPCHQRAGNNEHKPCDPEKCHMHGCHPATGVEFAIGCGMCKIGIEALPEETLKRQEEQMRNIDNDW